MTALRASKPGPSSVKVSGSSETGHDLAMTSEDALNGVFGTDDADQAEALLGHCLKALRPDEADDKRPADDQRQFILSIVADMAPRDPVERMLAVQMAATHVATIRAARWLATCDGLPQCEAHYTGFNKLARTFASQVEALRKHRNGGQQTVTVQHVNVTEGGQAIVGNVQAGGGARGER